MDEGQPKEPRRRPDRLDRRALARALAGSAAIHALLLLGLGGIELSVPTAGGPGVTADRPPPARGTLVALRVSLPARAIPAPPRPRLAVDGPPVPRLVVQRSVPSLQAAPAATLPSAAGSGPPGDAGDAPAGGARGEGTAPPVPRSVFPEWDPPGSVRGLEVTVRVRVDAEGRPTGEVELLPPTPDAGFNRRLVEKARRMEYRPARRRGVPVPGWAVITFVF